MRVWVDCISSEMSFISVLPRDRLTRSQTRDGFMPHKPRVTIAELPTMAREALKESLPLFPIDRFNQVDLVARKSFWASFQKGKDLAYLKVAISFARATADQDAIHPLEQVQKMAFEPNHIAEGERLKVIAQMALGDVRGKTSNRPALARGGD